MNPRRIPHTSTPEDWKREAKKRRTIGTPQQHAAALHIARRFMHRIPDYLQPDIENAALFALHQALDANPNSIVPYLRKRVKGAVIDRLRELDILGRTTRREVKEGQRIVQKVDVALAYRLDSGVDTEAMLDDMRVIRQLDHAISQALDYRHRVVVRAHLMGVQQWVTAQNLGVTEARVCQMFWEAVEKMREQLGIQKERT